MEIQTLQDLVPFIQKGAFADKKYVRLNTNGDYLGVRANWKFSNVIRAIAPSHHDPLALSAAPKMLERLSTCFTVDPRPVSTKLCSSP